MEAASDAQCLGMNCDHDQSSRGWTFRVMTVIAKCPGQARRKQLNRIFQRTTVRRMRERIRVFDAWKNAGGAVSLPR